MDGVLVSFVVRLNVTGLVVCFVAIVVVLCIVALVVVASVVLVLVDVEEGLADAVEVMMKDEVGIVVEIVEVGDDCLVLVVSGVVSGGGVVVALDVVCLVVVLNDVDGVDVERSVVLCDVEGYVNVDNITDFE